MKFFIMAAIALGLLSTNAMAEVTIIVDISDQRMYVETPDSSFTWEVSTARQGLRTPRGVFQPYLLEKMHYSSKYENAPMPNSIFFYGGYAIHATEDVNHLGKPASHGCVRLSPQNARWLYRIVQDYGKENTKIYIQD